MTPTEKATKAIDEGFQWLLAFVAMRLGEEKSPSYELRSAASEARKAAWAAMSAYGRFKALASGDDPDAEGRQQALPGTRAVTVPEPSPKVVALVEAIDAAVDKAISDTFGDIPDEPPVDQELDNAQQAIDEQLAELDCMDDAVSADVTRADAGLFATLGAEPADDAEGVWSITRELDRVMATLKGLAPGCGPEAVRAALCGLEETPKAEDGQIEADPESPIPGTVETTDDQVDADAPPTGECTCGLVGTCDRCVEHDRREAEAEHAALRALNPSAESEPGRPAGEAPKKRRGSKKAEAEV